MFLRISTIIKDKYDLYFSFSFWSSSLMTKNSCHNGPNYKFLYKVPQLFEISGSVTAQNVLKNIDLTYILI